MQGCYSYIFGLSPCCSSPPPPPPRSKKDIIPIARDLGNLGFGLMATTGTAKVLREAGVPCEIVLKIHEGRPNPMDVMK